MPQSKRFYQVQARVASHRRVTTRSALSTTWQRQGYTGTCATLLAGARSGVFVTVGLTRPLACTAKYQHVSVLMTPKSGVGSHLDKKVEDTDKPSE